MSPPRGSRRPHPGKNLRASQELCPRVTLLTITEIRTPYPGGGRESIHLLENDSLRATRGISIGGRGPRKFGDLATRHAGVALVALESFEGLL
jgi:hypothetical protein